VPDNHPTIAITGAGSGLGAALACRFARAGYWVAVTDADMGRAETVLAGITRAGGSGFAQQMDVTSNPGWDALYQRILTEWGALNILVNNAGVAAAGRLEDSAMEDWQWVMDTNLMGVIRGCHRFIPMLRAQGKGHIVNVASFAGMIPVPELSAYATAKAGVVALSEQLRVDLAGSGVGISLLCPAYVQTAILESMRSKNQHHKQLAARWMARSRINAEDVADMVFEAVSKKRFLILTHPETRWMWRFKRWLPQTFHRSVLKAKKQMAGKFES
jgi:NADP-dependent 3-hydroxy acid dehydrogenase YdfG